MTALIKLAADSLLLAPEATPHILVLTRRSILVLPTSSRVFEL
jgi:hypothetical protein